MLQTLHSLHHDGIARLFAGLIASLCVLCGLVLPASANPFLPADAQCGEPVDLWGLNASSEAEDASLAAEECDTARLDDPAFNVCFEGAEVPISTLPQLIAETQAERLARQIAVASAGLELPTPVEAAPEPALASRPDRPMESVFVPKIPRPRVPEQACSAYPEECNALPAIPHVEFAGSASPASHPEPSDYAPPAHTLQIPPPSPWSHPGLGPSSEHRAPPEQPPRA